MRARMMCLIFFAALTATYPLSAAADDESPSAAKAEKGRVEWGREVSGVKCAIGTDREANRFAADEPVWAVLRTRNFGLSKVEVIYADLFVTYKLAATGPDGKPLPYTLYGQQQKSTVLGEFTTTLLGTNDEEADKLQLNRVFDMTRAGKYEVVFSRGILLPNQKTERLESNKLTVTITEPKAK